MHWDGLSLTILGCLTAVATTLAIASLRVEPLPVNVTALPMTSIDATGGR